MNWISIVGLLLIITVVMPLAAETTADLPQPLSEEECFELAERIEDPGPEVAGGALSNEHLTYIVIALAAAVVALIFA